MADFCNICTAQMAASVEMSNSPLDYLIIKRLPSGDIDINKIFDEHIKNDMEKFLSDELYGITVGGVCEYCGLTRLTVKKENDILYLVAWCWKNSKENQTGKYKIAIITEDNELEYQEDELIKYLEEN